MARKKTNPIDDPPAASSDEDEPVEQEEDEVAGEEEEEEVEEEPEEEEHEEEDDAEELEEEEEEDNAEDEKEEEDDETDSDPRSFTIKEHSKSKPPPSKIRESVSPVLVSNKRPADTAKNPTAKKPRGGGVEEKKAAPSRFWSEEDEIVILKGLIAFQQDKKVDPTSDSTAFYQYIKDTLSVESSKSQLLDKVRRLKKKYRNSLDKARNGEDPFFSRPREHEAFQLSKQIWGAVSAPTPKNPSSNKMKKITAIDKSANPTTHPPTDNANPSTPVNGNATIANFSQLYPYLNLSLIKGSFSADMVSKDVVGAMASSLRCLDKSKLEMLDEDWKQQILAECDLCSKRAILLQKQIKLTLG